MKISILSIIALALAPAWGGALSAAPPAGGTISIKAETSADGETDPPPPSFVAATADALAAKGFTILEDPGHAAYVVELVLNRDDVGTGSAKASGGTGITSTGGLGVGAGVSIPFSQGNTRLVPLQRTRLELRIRKQGEDAVVWHGAAVTVRAAGTRKGADSLVAATLTQAALASYPAVREDAVGVP